MPRLDYIKKKENSTLLLLGVSEEGESARYTVDESVYENVGAPQRGEELSDSQLWEIAFADEYYRAKKKALSLLSLADNNRRTLKVKLLRYGIRREIADGVVSEMVSLGYVDEERQLERLILKEANKRLVGPYKIIPKLARRGYGAEDIRRAISALVQSGELDFNENKRMLIEKKLPVRYDCEELRALLYKQGYKK